jgi:hypothetical protein
MILLPSSFVKYLCKCIKALYNKKMSSLSLMLRSASPEREGRLAPPEREGREGFLGPSISNYTQLWASMQIKGYIKKYHGIPRTAILTLYE